MSRECQANGRWGGSPPTECVASAFFEVLSGPCTVEQGGRCVSRTGYDNDEHCVIAATAAMTIANCPVFSTESDFDYLTIGGQQFSGNDCPTNVEVGPSDEITWDSDESETDDGFTVCRG